MTNGNCYQQSRTGPCALSKTPPMYQHGGGSPTLLLSHQVVCEAVDAYSSSRRTQVSVLAPLCCIHLSRPDALACYAFQRTPKQSAPLIDQQSGTQANTSQSRLGTNSFRITVQHNPPHKIPTPTWPLLLAPVCARPSPRPLTSGRPRLLEGVRAAPSHRHHQNGFGVESAHLLPHTPILRVLH